MRLGAPVGKTSSVDELIARTHLAGYTAVYGELHLTDTEAKRAEFTSKIRAQGLVIAEVGAWSNPLSPIAEERTKALELCKQRLALADEIGARCCVNISGSRGLKWDGPHPLNLTSGTFEQIVDCVREIIDAVKPRRSFYTLETMPWMFPDSTESYRHLVKAIDRPQFAVHFDPVNLISSPQLYFNNGAMIRDFVTKLGKYIKSVHCKDIRIEEQLTLHLNECRPGLGGLDHAALFNALKDLDPDTPIMLEHLPDEEYPLAAKYLRAVAAQTGVKL
jgi:sugar phosphate isomerase/epimerase